jgi:phosphate starvation-inducible PhoH-like protein
MSKHRSDQQPVTRQQRRELRKSKRDGSGTNSDMNSYTPKKPGRARSEPVQPLTPNQELYDQAFRTKRIIAGLGPAGTGKTWFAISRAAEALKKGEISKIYLTRPIVDAEERGLGFLPGELDDKFAPYIRPVHEALVESFGASHLSLLLKNKTIEALPLAFMRGSTLKDCWMIADEMQNATRKHLLLLLTRIGPDCKIIINGDPSQVDIPPHQSGLTDVFGFMSDKDFVGTVRFTKEDIVRDGIIRDIIDSFEANP